ncbi:MAG TPA: FMN-binding glutamate synthase family protein [Acidiferrobacteraceae bacterium]|nr:FMN-binding glutamate synthase family protein [Acidiferrobacteraceae bacterium]
MPEHVISSLEVLAYVFIFVIGMIVAVIVVLYAIDVAQTGNAIRRNYPVIGRFRHIFERLGEFFRQYFFAMDREELPFNRAERSWVYRASQNIDNMVAFGSTRDLRPSGTVMFVNCPFPTLEVDASLVEPMTIGADCEHPFKARSLFNISAMSFGALSVPAVRALSEGAALAGCWMNTGEGGLSPFHLEGGADLIFQIGTAKYGVRDEAGELSDEKLREVAAYEQVKMFELKLSQGAKPGKGGILPKVKVTPLIAGIRGIPPYQDSISPNRHPDISSIDDLLTTLHRIRSVTGKPVGFKVVIGAYGWLDALFATIKERGSEWAPDFITLDSADGGSGAAPMSLIDNMGLPLRETLPLLVDKLEEYGLRDRIRVIASGKLVTPTEMAWALCMGADFINSARGFMLALGCIQALQCNKDTCPTGIATHNPKLQRGLNVKRKAIRVQHYVDNMVHEVGVIAHSCGVPEPRRLERYHARIVTENGRSVSLHELYPTADGDAAVANDPFT